MKTQFIPFCQVTAIINRTATAGKNLVAILREQGISTYTLASGRTALLKERSGLIGKFLPGRDLIGAPADCISFLTDMEHEDAAITAITEGFNLAQPGRGTVFTEEISFSGHAPAALNTPTNTGSSVTAQTQLIGICCIVQRSEGDTLAQVVLDSGIGSPAIVFGEGTGLRDKLGLMRITIPAEKEVLTIIAHADEADGVMDLLIDAGKLDLPGRGFIFLYPVNRGVIDPRVSIGSAAHAASMDQVILALDELKGNTQWRRHGLDSTSGSTTRQDRAFLNGLLDLNLRCDEGRASDLVAAAMTAGAAGATISKIKLVTPAQQGGSTAPSPAREQCSLIIAAAQADTIITAVENAGLLDEKTHGEIMVRQVPKACTYLGEKTKRK